MTQHIKWDKDTREPMQVNEKDGVVYLSYPAFDQLGDYVHGFSTRIGGISKDHLGSMNLSFTRGDLEENVRENFTRIGSAIGFTPENIVMSDQTHTTNVRLVKEEDRGNGYTRPRAFHDVDGLITNTKGLVLTTSYADCVPLYFIDPVHEAIGLSHSGWKGTVGKIGKVTIEKMSAEFGTDPKDLQVAIGPSICQDCYEVSEDVIEQFRAAFHQEHWSQLFYAKANGKYQLNLWMANRIIFMEAGIPESHIHMPGICTCCNPDFLFSHRASKGRRGNLAAFLGLK